MKKYVDGRISELREYVDGRVSELREYVDMRFERIEAEIAELRREVAELRNRLWWVVATVVLGWVGVILTQVLLLLVRGAPP